MDTRYFGAGDISLPGFGMTRLPLKAGCPETGLAAAQKMAGAAIGAGVNRFGTAWGCRGGEPESAAGIVLSRRPRDSCRPAAKTPVPLMGDKSEMETIFASQPKKLRTDFFGFCLVHAPRKSIIKKFEELEAREFLPKKKERGLIRRLGFSFHDRPDLHQTPLDPLLWDFAQIQLNCLEWGPRGAKTLNQTLFERKIPVMVMVMEPARGGMLALAGEEAAGILRGHDANASPASFALRFAASPPALPAAAARTARREPTFRQTSRSAAALPKCGENARRTS
jgi:predicted aldo/keto reductase-like oxidoreductase